jgi:BASS family bile acid:Na+ symporter
MMTRKSGVSGRSSIPQFLQEHLLKWIVLSYALAAVAPAPGLWMRDVPFLVIPLPAGASRTAVNVTITLPKLLLALLLFNAGMRVRLVRVVSIARRPATMLAGLAANLAVPLVFLALAAPALRAWPDSGEAALVLVGLALVTAMPIAGSSTGWAQAADGDMALSLGLVLGSTLLSPLSTPVSLHALAALAPGPHGEVLHRLAGHETGAFLATWVLLPSVLGIATRAGLGEARATACEHRMKVIAPVVLLLLCYVNASGCLPAMLDRPRWEFLGFVQMLVSGLCIAMFAAGYALARVLRTDRAQRAALLFGLGMNNNGTGLVLASVALASEPIAMLPIIAYNLTQHLVAGCVDAMLRRPDDRDDEDSDAPLLDRCDPEIPMMLIARGTPATRRRESPGEFLLERVAVAKLTGERSRSADPQSVCRPRLL